jgi:uncharacterized protein with PQ loop repeat
MDPRRKKLLLSVVYWLAVLIVSIAILVLLISLLESQDSSSVNGGAWILSLSSARPI